MKTIDVINSYDRSMLVPLRLAADARNLELITKLDPRIDEVYILCYATYKLRLIILLAGFEACRISSTRLR